MLFILSYHSDNNFIAKSFMDEDNESFEEQQKRHAKLLMAKISYSDDTDSSAPKRYKYNTDSITPFLHFYKLLALRPCEKIHKYRLQLNIPDTIIFNDKDSALMWIFTNERGEVTRVDNVPYYTITSKLTEGALEKQLIAVLKKSEYGYGGVTGNDVKVVSAAQMKTVLSAVLGSRGEVSVLQRFVKCQSVKPSILRTCWRSGGNHEGWVLSSNYEYTSTAKVNEISKFIVNTKMHTAFNAVKCTSEKHLKETLLAVARIAKFVETHLKVTFTELVCDFIRDEGGNWWYLNTRAFILMHDIKVDVRLITMHDDVPLQNVERRRLESYTRCRKCRYCYKVIADHLMTHRLTLMMILQCDQHLIRLGKSFPWLDRSYQLHLDAVNLYVEHKVCHSCYKFYTEVQKLVALQQKLARLTGVRIPADNKNTISITAVPYFKGQSAQFGTRLQRMKYETEMPPGWQLPQQRQLKVQLTKDSLLVQKYRVMIYVHGLRDIPASFLGSKKKYSLQYELFGQKIKFPIRLQGEVNEGLFKVSIEKIKLFYFFAENRQAIRQYIKTHPSLQVVLYEDQERFGVLQLELAQFRSDKVIKRDFFKMFSGKKVFPYLSWGLFISVGLDHSGTISSSSLKLSSKDGLLVPQPQYHNADPLPQDWINMIREKPDKQMERQPTSEAPQSQAYSQQASSIKHLIAEELQAYSRRQTPCAPQSSRKRKPYY